MGEIPIASKGWPSERLSKALSNADGVPQAIDADHYQRHADQPEGHVVQDRPALHLEDDGGEQARRRRGAEHKKIVERLRLAALSWPIGRGEQGRGADEHEVPTDAIEAECASEVPDGGAHERDGNARD